MILSKIIFFLYNTNMAYAFVSEKTGKPRRAKKASGAKRGAKKSTKAKVVSNTAKINELTKTMNNSVEQKIQTLSNIYQAKPLPQLVAPALGPLYYYNACLGDAPLTPAPANAPLWPGPNGQSNFNGLAGFQWPQGTGPTQRIGRYLYLKHTTMQMRLAMLNTVSNATPTQFRVIVYKAKRNAAAGTGGGNPNEDLFLNNEGRALGINNLGIVESKSFEYMNMLVNKRNYTIVSDTKCILQPSTIAVQGANPVGVISTAYPPEKTFSLKLTHNSKTAFSNFNAPLDLNYQYCVSVIAAPLGQVDTRADDWRISFRGTVSCMDS